MKTIYYYQSFCGLDKLLTHINDIDVIILSSIHFGINSDKIPYIHLNDNNPSDKIFDPVWKDINKASSHDTTILLMVGGAGGAYELLFKNFTTYYPLLKGVIKDNHCIKGIDLDIEEEVDINDVKKLINTLMKDFGKDFIITMAPVSTSLLYDGGGMGGFSYKKLYNSEEGKYIKWFNTQCYGTFNKETFDNIIKNGYPADKIVMGMISFDFNNNNFNDALTTIKNVKKEYPNMAGVFDWEYINAPPDKNDPSQWAKQIKDIHYDLSDEEQSF